MTGDTYSVKPVAHIRNAMKSKFGIPRQSLLAQEVISEIVFEPEFRIDETLRGIEGFSHLWLIWYFSETADHGWSPTVRPPRLGGNERMGVFATRSPFRPNGLGLSAVKLLKVEKRANEGSVLTVAGADLMDGTPIFDIKPYLPYADSIPDASCGFAPDGGKTLCVDMTAVENVLTDNEKSEIKALLERDPRPRYQDDPERVYAMRYGEKDIKFKVEGDKMTVLSAE
ncbi:MAG: tRNA (N6-threonylcarbamoyladenosine(37)-N6)-methyltransferase TrmO [Clostridia bacterium]|nr:tRNA (N6-threonylcarbamoyladenosine(37)-N6)-methyltransferase TrmO [Clostridia bacterium]